MTYTNITPSPRELFLDPPLPPIMYFLIHFLNFFFLIVLTPPRTRLFSKFSITGSRGRAISEPSHLNSQVHLAVVKLWLKMSRILFSRFLNFWSTLSRSSEHSLNLLPLGVGLQMTWQFIYDNNTKQNHWCCQHHKHKNQTDPSKSIDLLRVE